MRAIIAPSRGALLALLSTFVLVACSSGNGGGGNSVTTQSGPTAEEASAEAEQLLRQFGGGANLFSRQGLQALLDHPDTSSSIVVVQLMRVTDQEAFQRYEEDIGPVLAQFGATVEFASEVETQMLGERRFDETRVLQFANTPMFIDALRSDGFAAAMTTLFSATANHAWLVGHPVDLPFDVSGVFVDERLAHKSREEAIALLSANSADAVGEDSLSGNPEAIIDMIVSDSPEPFYMVNLISLREQALYPDGRETDLTGREANDVYGQSVVPQLLARNSGPILSMDVAVTLTAENTTWDQVAIARYASRDAFLNIFALNPSSGDTLIHKDAGVQETLVYLTNQRHVDAPKPVNGNRYDSRYCQLVTFWAAGGVESSYATTRRLNDCPQVLFEQIPDDNPISNNSLKPISGTRYKEGPLFDVIDWADDPGTPTSGERIFSIEGLEFRDAGTAYVDWTSYEPYGFAGFEGNAVFYYSAGRRVFELTDPMGSRYIMHSYSQQVDPSLGLEDLESLGARLTLPPEWEFSTRILTNTLAVPSNGRFSTVRDELKNSYLLLR